MRSIAIGAVGIAVLGAATVAQEAPRFTWERSGIAALPDAAAEARSSGARLLLGLSGSPT